jgi:hypothetical protein
MVFENTELRDLCTSLGIARIVKQKNVDRIGITWNSWRIFTRKFSGKREFGRLRRKWTNYTNL